MINSKPRIAFCFSWQARTLDQTYLFFQKNLFDAAKEQWFDYDVFCAVEDDEDIDKVKLLNPTKVEKIKSSEVEKIIERKYWNFIRNEAFTIVYYAWIKSLLQQIYKTQRSVQLIWETKYQLILRLRFDTLFINKFNFITIYDSIKNWWIICNDVNVWHKNWLFWFLPRLYTTHVEISDLFFIGGKNMIKFCHIFDNFEMVITSEYKIYKSLRPLYKLFLKIDKYINIFNTNHWMKIPHVPLYFVAKLFWFQILSWDAYFYKFLKNEEIYKTNISMGLIRKNGESWFAIFEKTLYEQ